MADTNVAINATSVTEAVRGAVFLADADVIPAKADLAKFTLNAESVTLANAGGSGSAPVFYNLGHMSNDTLPEFSLMVVMRRLLPLGWRLRSAPPIRRLQARSLCPVCRVTRTR